MAVLLGSINTGIGAFSTIPIGLKSIADKKGFYVAPLRFRGNGQTSKGYVIFDSDGMELVEIEPYFGYGGDKWYVKHKYRSSSQNRLTYHKSLKGVVNSLKDIDNSRSTGYIFRDYKQYI
jgi:hypothetical protein